jgi:AcrR family transcriptional regulator
MSLTIKGIEKKKYILEKATSVFIREGYTSVTMKDIVEECNISRGGLYKYYSSTKEIFEDILSFGKENDYFVFTKGMENGENAIEILSDFLQQQKSELLNIKNTIRRAIYEFFLSHKNNALNGILKQNYTETVSVISKTLNYGISRNEITKLASNDVEKFANHIIILLEGLSILALGEQISSKLIDEQLDIIIKDLI